MIFVSFRKKIFTATPGYVDKSSVVKNPCVFISENTSSSSSASSSPQGHTCRGQFSPTVTSDTNSESMKRLLCRCTLHLLCSVRVHRRNSIVTMITMITMMMNMIERERYLRYTMAIRTTRIIECRIPMIIVERRHPCGRHLIPIIINAKNKHLLLLIEHSNSLPLNE